MKLLPTPVVLPSSALQRSQNLMEQQLLMVTRRRDPRVSGSSPFGLNEAFRSSHTCAFGPHIHP